MNAFEGPDDLGRFDRLENGSDFEPLSESDMAALARAQFSVTTVFLLTDISGSMRQNGNIHQLNTAIQELGPQLRALESSDLKIRIAVCSFGREVAWRTFDADGKPSAVPVEHFAWTDLEAGGYTPVGKAFSLLNEALSRETFFRNDAIVKPPVIVLITDGDPTDAWEDALEQLRGNRWFTRASRIAIGPKERREKEVLERFTGDPSSIISYFGADQDARNRLGEIIRACVGRATVYMSQLSQMTTIGMLPSTTEEAVLKQTAEIVLSVARDFELAEQVTDDSFDLQDDFGDDMGDGSW